MTLGRFNSNDLKPGTLLVFCVEVRPKSHLLLVERKQDGFSAPYWSYMNSEGMCDTHVMEWSLLDRLNTDVLKIQG